MIFTLGSAVGLFQESESGKEWYPFYFERNSGNQYHELFSEERIIKSTNAVLNKIRAINPSTKIIITLSPIPLNGLIRNKNELISPIELDCLSKSLQRDCIQKVLAKRRDFYYFPSFEIIKWMAPLIASQFHTWRDPRHPQDKTIDLAMEAFMENFFYE